MTHYGMRVKNVEEEKPLPAVTEGRRGAGVRLWPPPGAWAPGPAWHCRPSVGGSRRGRSISAALSGRTPGTQTSP